MNFEEYARVFKDENGKINYTKSNYWAAKFAWDKCKNETLKLLKEYSKNCDGLIYGIVKNKIKNL